MDIQLQDIKERLVSRDIVNEQLNLECEVHIPPVALHFDAEVIHETIFKHHRGDRGFFV